MTAEDVLLTRLHNQLLVMAPGASPETVVRRLGAVQAQDFHGARWGVVQRTDADDGASFDEAFADGRILRTHVLRPTWHFVSPGDIRWMLSLSADRVVAAGRYYRERLGITEGMLDRGMTTIARELEDNGPKTRAEIDGLLDGAGLDSSGGRNAHYLLQAEAQALICSGPPRGRQQTYALLRDRAPAGAVLSRDDACARLAERFFQSHGPAALRDFAWWSGLSAAEAKIGLESNEQRLSCEVVDGKRLWFVPGSLPEHRTPVVRFLPNYDEYIVAYVDRSKLFDVGHAGKLDARGNILFQHSIIVDGRILGTWKVSRSAKKSTIEVTLFRRFNKVVNGALTDAFSRCSRIVAS